MAQRELEWEWRHRAKCNKPEDHADAVAGFQKDLGWDAHGHTELWFPPRSAEAYGPIAKYAKAVCFGRDGKTECPVRLGCLSEAIRNDEEHGIFGGMSHRERNALLRKLKRRGITFEQYLANGARIE